MICPRCKRSDRVNLTTADYDTGAGAEYTCYRQSCASPLGYEFRFAVNSAESRADSDAAKARSAGNAAAYKRSNV